MEGRAVQRAAVLERETRSGVAPAADVARAICTLKLVTVEIETRVAAQVRDESWRGDVVARVSAPVRLLYGTDLSQMDASSVSLGPLGTRYVVRVPPPARLATEVYSEDEAIDVRVGWLRLRTRAGEYFLGLARRALSEQARKMRLSPEDAEQVARATKEQVAKVVRAVVGADAMVEVRVIDEPEGVDTAAGDVKP